MNAAFLHALLEANLAAAAAVLFVLVARRPVIRLLGSGAAYLLWSVVPVAMLATLLPARTVVARPVEAASAVDATSGGGPGALATGMTTTDWSALATPVLLALWLGGVIVMAGVLMLRQQRFMADMAKGEAGPAVVGFFRPHIVTPDDFSERFSPLEQKLVLAHENIHLERHDARINAAVALTRCLCWFNPLVHVGARLLRADQEMSCDAAVVERRPRARRAYAETLLKTQLAVRPLPVGCYWPPAASHPLTERIDLLTRRPFSDERRLASAAAVMALVASAGALAWAAQPAREVSAPTLGHLADAAASLWPYAEAEQTIFILSPAETNDAAAGGAHMLTPGDGVQRPSGMPHPFSTAGALQRGEPGEIAASLCVSATGSVDGARLIRSSGAKALDDAAMQSLAGAKLQPATRNGAPLAVCDYLIAFQWPLEGGPVPSTSAKRTD